METKFRVYRRKAQYYETDQMGMIHHSNHIRWFEEARVDILEQLGMDYEKMEKRGIRIPVLSVYCEYKSRICFNDMVLIIPKIENFTGVRMTISYQIIDELEGHLRAMGGSTHCFLDENNRPISLKRQHQDVYRLFMALKGKDIFARCQVG